MTKQNGQHRIAWTDETWNPVIGCTVVSPGCANCYAMDFAPALVRRGIERYEGLTEERNGRAVWNGNVRLVESELDKPGHWRKGRRIFGPSMGDLFHEGVPFDYVDRVLAVCRAAPQHTFQILTKRPFAMAVYIDSRERDIPANVWLGVSAEDQKRALERIPYLNFAPRHCRTFVSYEPAIGPIEWDDGWARYVDWVIYGGESGRHHRPHQMIWAETAWEWSKTHGIAFFFKQGSALSQGENTTLIRQDGSGWFVQQFPDAMKPIRVK